MAILYVRGGSLLPSFKLPSLPTHIRVDMFFDRPAVMNALTKAERYGLSRSSLLVKQTAVKSIAKQGLAKPKLKVMTANPGMRLSSIAKLTTLRGKQRQAIIDRVREIQRRDPSPPGTPPHTHVPSGHMLGFSRNLYNAYDKMTHSAVAGPSKKGQHWTIPGLHEYGGTRSLTAWAWRPQYPGPMRRPIIRWVLTGTNPGGGWLPTGATKRVTYPARPFMVPALNKSRPRFAEFFRDAFSAGARGL